MSGSMRLQVFHPIYAREAAISHICMSLCAAMAEGGLDVRMVVPGRADSLRRTFVSPAFPGFMGRLAYRMLSERRVVSLAAKSFLKSLRRDDVVYLWPGTPLWLYQAVKDKGLVLVMERINTHRKTAKVILDDAYARLGMRPTHQFTDEAIADENAKLALADLVFSPSPGVTKSLLDAGVAPPKIIRSSYGWDPERFGARGEGQVRNSPFTALFMGRICVRKGVHLLLEAWSAAQVEGKLRLVGKLDDEIQRCCRALLSRSDVEAVPYTNDVAGVFAAADAFIFPTLEEGSPLVVYEAMASSLPVVTTPMGGGEIVRDGVEGLIVEPQEVQQLVQAIRRMAEDGRSRAAMSTQAHRRAEGFTWSNVGKRRSAQLIGLLGGVERQVVAS